jgi:Zn-dependent protease
MTAVVTSVAFMLTLLGHELAHAVVARAHGMEVKRVTLWLLGGVTELGSASPSPRAEALMAGAGPAASFLTGVVSAALALAVGPTTIAGTALVWLSAVSVVLAVFNLLPGSPLDGGRLLHAFVWWRVHDRERAGLVATASGRVIGYVLIAIGLVNVVLGSPAGLWLALVGWFVMSGAAAERAAMFDRHLAGITAGEIGRPTYPAPHWWTLAELIARMPADAAVSGTIPVVDVDGRTTGVVTVTDLERVPAAQRGTITLGEIATHRPTPVLLDPAADLGAAIEGIRRAGGVAVVEDQGKPVALIAADDIARAIRLTLLGWHAPAGRR